jgi:hypothetical protein
MRAAARARPAHPQDRHPPDRYLVGSPRFLVTRGRFRPGLKREAGEPAHAIPALRVIPALPPQR